MKSLLPLLLATISLITLTGTARAADADTVNGNLLLEVKGEVEVYHNGRKIVLRDKSDSEQHFRVKLPARNFKVGDVIVLRILSPFVYRSIVAAINLDGKAGQIAIKRNDWRYLGEDKNAIKITAAELQANKNIPAAGTPDPSGKSQREKLGILPDSNGGSEWVKTEEQMNAWYCIGFALTPEMLKTPLATP
jgi:hypothetical protein